MSLDLEKLGAVIRLSQLPEQLVKQQTAMQEAADRMRDIVDPPAMRKLREMHELLTAIADPPYMRQMREMVDSTQIEDACRRIRRHETADRPRTVRRQHLQEAPR